MPTPANGGKETQGEDNNALQMIELRRQLQEKDRAIESLEQERDEEHQRREHHHERDREQLEAQEEEIGRLRQQLYHLQTRPLTTGQVQVEAPAVTTVTTPAVAPAASSLASTPKVKLDKYDGKTSIVQWWLKFMTFLSLQKVSEAVAINTLPFYIAGAAESWFFSLDNSLKTSLESIRQAIHNRFKPSSRHNLQVMDVKQKDTESVEDFIHRVTSLTNDRAVDQDWLITVIMNGLKEDLSTEVIKADPQTLEDVRNIASRAEMAGRRRTTSRRCRSPLI